MRQIEKTALFTNYTCAKGNCLDDGSEYLLPLIFV